jgi:hypothetical protein
MSTHNNGRSQNGRRHHQTSNKQKNTRSQQLIFACPEQGFTPTNLADLPTMSLDYQNLMHTRWLIMTTNKMDAYKMANEVTHQESANED